MARRPRLAIREALCKLFSGKYLKERAKETGVVKRDRNVKIVDLFWTLVLGSGQDGPVSYSVVPLISRVSRVSRAKNCEALHP